MNKSVDQDPSKKKLFRGSQRKTTLLFLLAFILILAGTIGIILLCSNEKQKTANSSGHTDVILGSNTTEPSAESSENASAPETIQPGMTEQQETDPPETEIPVPIEDNSWKLILVNADHPLPEDFSVALKELRFGHHVDERIYPELQQMFDDARAAGIYPLINESFRTRERQQEIMDKYIASYEAAGMSHEEAVKKAREIVALPGTSEHELGLALDIIAEYDADSTATWNWLKENSWKYGFILRYPADKVEITGYSYEPWHFRYVGCPAAQEITEQGLCLEEYVEKLAKQAQGNN